LLRVLIKEIAAPREGTSVHIACVHEDYPSSTASRRAGKCIDITEAIGNARILGLRIDGKQAIWALPQRH